MIQTDDPNPMTTNIVISSCFSFENHFDVFSLNQSGCALYY